MIDQIICGDCRTELKQFPDNHFHAIVTDPPYELGFMGKKWDGTGIAHDVNLWRECLRVLRPGGYLLAFGGSRTYHRMACAIEDAGFILHPMIGWVQGQGFPKASNLSKMLDKDAGTIGKTVLEIKRSIRDAFNDSKLTLKDLNLKCGFEASGYLRESSTWATVLPSFDKWLVIKSVLSINSISDEIFQEAEREVICTKHDSGKRNISILLTEEQDYDITAPATPEAKAWDGWYYGKQSLKPALEPICMAQKLPEGRMVDNIRTWGCGGINVDGCRIGTDSDEVRIRKNLKLTSKGCAGGSFGNPDADMQRKDEITVYNNGRFPANLILQHSPGCVKIGRKRIKPLEGHRPNPVNVQSDGNIQFNNKEPGFQKVSYTDATGHEEIDDYVCSEDCPIRLMNFQSGILQPAKGKYIRKHGESQFLGSMGDSRTDSPNGIIDIGGASRFFLNIDPDPFQYCAKASPAERGGSKHPTMKPLALMRYLCRLITPPGGLILDPFAGSGTTCLAAIQEGFHCIGIEKEPEYVAIARKRIAAVPARLDRWAEVP